METSQNQEPVELAAADEQLLRELAERARGAGLKLTREGGLLGKLTNMVVEGVWKARWMTFSAIPGRPGRP